MNFNANIIQDSISPHDIQFTTVEVTVPKFINAEINTHRVFSRNGSSSRAIPIIKTVEEVTTNPFLPPDVRKNQKGMQGFEHLSDEERDAWHTELKLVAEFLGDKVRDWNEAWGIHKQHLNRIIEPFKWQKILISSTEWSNWDHLRLDKAADPSIYIIADLIKKARDESTPKLLNFGEWHTPYYSDEEDRNAALKGSTARCARVSYKTHDNQNPDIQKDIGLHDMLKKEQHMSPFEHQAMPMNAPMVTNLKEFDPVLWERGVTHVDRNGAFWSGNLRGWVQHRQLI